MKALRVGLVIGLLLALALVSACSGYKAPSGSSSGGSASGNSGGTTVTEQNIQFQPQSLDVKAGDTVTFTNNDSVPHQVVADDGSFDLGEQQPGQSVTWKATKAGSVAYHCKIHPAMTGTLNVK